MPSERVMPSERGDQLEPTLSVSGAVALALGIVIGAGLLILPGLAYREAGSAAVLAWGIDALIVIPLLVVFGYLGSRYPQAGGIAGFTRAAFGATAGNASEVLLLGTFTLGIPAIASVGGEYVAFVVGGTGAAVASALIVLLAGVTNGLGARLSSTVQQLVTYLLVSVLAAVAVAGIVSAGGAGGSDGATGLPTPGDWTSAIPVLGLIFFAFTGWEMLSFTTEEYKNPRRDYPLAVAISFVVVVALYLALAVATQLLLDPSDADLAKAPVAAIAAEAIGGFGASLIAVAGIGIVVANVNGALWAASRLTFASARDGVLPGGLARLSGPARLPRNSVVAVTIVFLLMTGAQATGLLSQQTMLSLAGQNFFLLYLVSVAAYVRLVRSIAARAFGLAASVPCVLVAGSFGPDLLYPAVLVAAGVAVTRVQRGGGARTSAPVESVTHD